MGKTAVVADLHLGPRNGPFGRILEDRLILTVKDLLKSLKECLVQDVVFAGDTFDRPVLSPRFVHTFSEVLHDYWCQGMRFIFISGNHECNEHDGNALSYLPFIHTHVFTPCIAGLGSCNDGILAVPYMLGYTAADVIVEALTNLGGVPEDQAPKVMVGHFGIYDDSSSSWMIDDKQAVPIKWLLGKLGGTSVEYAIVGHYHTERYWDDRDTRVFQVGALSPRSFADSGFRYGNAVIIDTSNDAVSCTIHSGFVSGIRYLGGHDTGSYAISEYTMNTSWYLTRFAECKVGCEVVNDPKTLSDVKNGAITYIDQAEKKYIDPFEQVEKEHPAVEEVVQTFIEHDEELRSKQGLLSDAISGVRGDIFEVEDKPSLVSYEPRRLRKMVR